MVAPFNQAWVLLKQRGHELNLPEPQLRNEGRFEGVRNPQELTDARVDEATIARRALDNFETMGANSPPSVSSAKDAMDYLKNRKIQENYMKRYADRAETANLLERHYEGLQGDLDRQTLARMGQQPEADEMEAMGVPPMSRILGGTPPANIGRAGSTGENENIEPPNPFPKPAGQNVHGDLMDWASGAGRKEGKPGIVERTKNPFEDLSEMYNDDMYNEIHDEPLHENNPAKHNITSTTLRASPRQQKRRQMDSGRAEFKRPDREGPIGMSPSQRAMNLLRRNAAN